MKLSKEYLLSAKAICATFKVLASETAFKLFGHIEMLEWELIESRQENLQRLEEVKGLQRQVQSLTECIENKHGKLRRLREDLSKAWATINAEREARVLLEATLERAMLDHQPLVLPKEVDLAVKHYSRGGVLHKNGIVHSILSESSAIARLARQKLDEIGDDDLLFHALAFGYTVEETQSFTTNRKLDEDEIKALRNWYKGALINMEDDKKSGKEVAEFAKEAIEEVALYLGGAELLSDLSSFCKYQLAKEQAK